MGMHVASFLTFLNFTRQVRIYHSGVRLRARVGYPFTQDTASYTRSATKTHVPNGYVSSTVGRLGILLTHVRMRGAR